MEITNNTDFQKRATAYSLLAHIKTNKTLASGPIDIFVPIVKNALSELYPDGTVKGGNISEITAAIKLRFSLDFPIPVMKNILKKISIEINSVNDKEYMRIFNDGGFWIDKYIFEDYKELIQDSRNSVSQLVELYKKFCKVYNLDTPDNEVDLLKFIEQNRTDISYYLSHEQKCSGSQSVIAAQFVNTFRNTDGIFDNLRSIYLGSMLASYLEYQPKKVDMNVELLLDTNFIISLLDLNTPESTKTCNTLINVSKNLGYSFTVLHDTIDEIQGLLSYKSENLNSAIIAKTINREDIYNACDRKHLTSADLDRISDNIEDVLTNQYQFHIIPNTTTLQNKAKFSKEYSILKQYRNSDKSALHDAMALLYVKEKRQEKKIYKFEKVNCWFVNNAITHENEHDNVEIKEVFERKNEQPEIIKVDDLLNILWLSNPSLGINSSEVVDMGLASMVSYTLNSSLPKARIIKELDDNIQKYRDDRSISDKDFIRLSTRIVDRQIKDVQELNELAVKGQASFAARIKEESQKQEQIEIDRAKKLEFLMSSFEKGIDDIKDNSDKMKQKHAERMQELALKEEELDKSNSALKEQGIKLNLENQKLREQNKDRNFILEKLWKKENKRHEKEKEMYINQNIDKQRYKAKKNFIIFISVFVLFVIIDILCFTVFLDKATIEFINSIINYKCVSWLVGVILAFLGLFTYKDYYNWTRNPSYSVNQRKLITIPDNLKPLEYENFINKPEEI